jgi:hypothetical protein
MSKKTLSRLFVTKVYLQVVSIKKMILILLLIPMTTILAQTTEVNEYDVSEYLDTSSSLMDNQLDQNYIGYTSASQIPVVDTLPCLYSRIDGFYAPILVGEIVDDGGEACQYRFRYKLAGDSYSYTNWYGPKTTGEMFGVVVFPLPEGIYHFNAQARNSLGESAWGDEETCTLPPSGPPPSNTLAEALDTTLTIDTGGNEDWFYQTATSYYGGDAAQSGDISHNQQTWMQTMVTGPGTLSFYWKVSSEANYDFLEFYIDGVRQNRISGNVNWQQKTYTVTGPGSHILLWQYAKDGSVSFGNDSGWVDRAHFASP